jgi:hypothetical protein
MKTKNYTQAFLYNPADGFNYLFSCMANSTAWFDSWENAYKIPRHERAMDIRYGDDTPFTDEEL